MSSTQPSQSFYSLTLEPSSAPTAAVCCNVIPGLKQQDQQIFEARGERVYLRRITENADRTESYITTVLEQDVFCIVRGVAAFRIPGNKIDHLAIVSDSGRVGMFEYDAEHNRLKKIHMESFGKSGVRRTVPGQYLASDTRGRCLMMASTEKNKLVYLFQRNPDGNIHISSPHEANSWATLCFDICALDVGWEHPVFGALEVDYSDAEADATGEMYGRRDKLLTYYTVDLGLNHVIKTWSDPVDYTANKIFGVPGGTDGPSGVIVCAEGRIYYKHDKFEPLSVQIPQRSGPLEDGLRSRIIVSGCTFLHRARHEFFFLLQTEDGDVFKLTMEMPEDDQGRKLPEPVSLTVKYFDTFPVATRMLLIRKGYIYVAAESGPSKLYHVDNLGDDPDFEPWNTFSSVGLSADPADALPPAYFQPRKLTLVSDMTEVPALHPLVRTRVENLLGEDTPQILTLQGKGNSSLFKMMRHGMSVSEVVSSDLGNIPYNNIWSLRKEAGDEYMEYLVLSSAYADRTVILGIADDVESLDNTAFLTNRATLFAGLMGDSTLVQVHARGVHSILENGNINEWPSPTHRTIVCAAANERQLLLGLSSGELAFFFMDSSGVLSALEEQPEMTGKVTAIGLSNTPRGKQQARYGVVGCDDHTIRVLSIELDSPLEARSVQAVSDVPTSIEVVEMLDPNSNTMVNFVHIGLKSGVYLRAIIDEVTGELSEVRTKFLGSKPVRVFPMEVQGQACIIACSSRPWICYHHPVTRQFTTTPLVTRRMDAAAPFVSEHLNGLCGIADSELRILNPGELGQRFVTEEIKLQYTPRNLARHPYNPVVYVIEGDANTMSKASADRLLEERKEMAPYAEGVELGNPRANLHWASCVQALDPVTKKAVTSTLHLSDNETALSCAVVQFMCRDWEPFLVVGTGKNMNVTGSAANAAPVAGSLHVYKLLEDGTKLEHYHKTRFEEPIYAIAPFQGRVAVGVGNELLVYDLGTKGVMRKSRGTAVTNTIVTMEAHGNRVVCGDVSDSLTYVAFKPEYNRMIPFIDDSIQRWTTCTAMLDYDTCAGGDKFGNLWILRCPDKISREADNEGLNGFIMNERTYLNGAPNRLELRAHYYVQDVPMSVQRTPLVAGGQDVLFWSGIQGTLGMLVPFFAREDVVFFTALEMQMRQEDPPLAGRDHLVFRSYYAPVRSVIDGDLCERFLELSYDKKQLIAAELERSVNDIEKKVQEMRIRVAF